MVTKTIILLVLYFLQVTLVVCQEYFAKRNQVRSRSRFFGPFEPEPLEKKYQEPEPLGLGVAWKKKSGAEAAKIISRLPSPASALSKSTTGERQKTPLRVVENST